MSLVFEVVILLFFYYWKLVQTSVSNQSIKFKIFNTIQVATFHYLCFIIIYSFYLVTGSYLSVPRREGSARSSLSEASGISGASNRTYINEASTLVLETIENGIKKLVTEKSFFHCIVWSINISYVVASLLRQLLSSSLLIQRTIKIGCCQTSYSRNSFYNIQYRSW